VLADLFVPGERGQHADERHGGGNFALAAAVELGLEQFERRHRLRGSFSAP
jgi:hypothetical protein